MEWMEGWLWITEAWSNKQALDGQISFKLCVWLRFHTLVIHQTLYKSYVYNIFCTSLPAWKYSWENTKGLFCPTYYSSVVLLLPCYPCTTEAWCGRRARDCAAKNIPISRDCAGNLPTWWSHAFCWIHVPTVSQWPHNGRITALFPEVTHEDFFRSVLGSAVGFKRDEIQSSLISPWEKFVS